MSKDRARIVAAGVASLAIAAAAWVGTPASQASRAAVVPGDDVRLNEIQVIGSHNSYKILPTQEEQDLIRGVIGDGYNLMEYEHAPLPEQFGDQAVRQIELDVWVDDAGGLFSQPLLRTATGLGPYRPELMDNPGIKAFHVQDVDYVSTCPTFKMCLQHVKSWSDANRGHVPIAILVELKDEPLVVSGFSFTEPEPWTAAAMDALDAEIRSVFPDHQTIVPDDVRGSASTLREAVLTTGWPTLGESRGKVMFMMDNGGGYRTRYLAGHPSLQGRVLFTNANPGDDDAAFIKRNNAHDPSIPGLVADGFVVRTRADGDTVEARAEDTTLRDAALASGAQWVSTDYPVPGMAVGFESSYYAAIPGGVVARCNPVNAPESCVDRGLDLVGVADPPQPAPPTRPELSTPGSTPGTTTPGPSVPGTGETTSTTSPGGTSVPSTSPGSTVPGSSTTRPSTPARPAPAAPVIRGSANYTG